MRANLRIEVTAPGGRVIACRRASNAVLVGGAALIGRLFAGGGTGITHMAVGTSDVPEGDGFATNALENPVEAALAAEAFSVDPPDPVKRVVRVRVRGTIPAAPTGTFREAALLSRSGEVATLYNRVIFAPIEKAGDHELTLFWEVGFPYGDLQWLL